MGDVNDNYSRLCEFLFDEADLLDRRRYLDWFELLAPDIHYRVLAGANGLGFSDAYQFPIFDDNARDLKLRVQQISDPALTHAENPAPFTRRFIGNIRVARGMADGEYQVASYILLYRNGGTINEQFLYSGVRRDLLRTEGASFKIARRDVELDCSIVTSPNISSFF